MKKIIIAVIVMAAIVSCKKNETTNASANITVSLSNIAGNWKVTDATFTQAGSSAAVNTYSSYPVCNKDDIFNFTAAGNYTITDAGTVCSPTSASAGTFTLVGDSLKYGTTAAKVEVLTATTMVTASNVTTVVLGTTVSGVFRPTFTKQ